MCAIYKLFSPLFGQSGLIRTRSSMRGTFQIPMKLFSHPIILFVGTEKSIYYKEQNSNQNREKMAIVATLIGM